MKSFLFAVGIMFAVTLAAVIGLRMSPDALAVIVGVASGVLASVPTSAILVWVLRQRDKQIEAQFGRAASAYYPPVVVVNGQGTYGAERSQTPPALLAPTSLPGTRDFKVIGQENTEIAGETLSPFWDQ